MRIPAVALYRMRVHVRTLPGEAVVQFGRVSATPN